MAPSVRSAFSRRSWRHVLPASKVRIRLRSISTNGVRSPTTPAFLLVRDGERHRDTFAAPAAYLRRETRGLAAGTEWPCDLGVDLSRGFRALKTWFTLKTYGIDKLGAIIARSCALASHLAARISAEPRLELLAPVNLNIVCFRYRAEDADRVNREIVVNLQESGIAAPSTTVLDGRLAIRAAIVNHRTDACDIDALVAAVLEFGARRWTLRRNPAAASRIANVDRAAMQLVRLSPARRGAMFMDRASHQAMTGAV